MNNFLTNQQYSKLLSLDVSTPQILIEPGESVVLQTFKIVDPQMVCLRWLSMHLVSTTSNVATKIDNSLGLFYTGIFGSQLPSGIPIIQVGVESSNLQLIAPAQLNTTSYYRCLSYLNPYYPCRISTPGTYVASLVNNTNELVASISVNGVALLYL